VVLLVGCGDSEPGLEPSDDGGPIGTPTGSAERLEVTFDAEVTPTDDAVTVHYEVTNDGDGPVLVPNRVPEPAGAGVRYRSTSAYVTERGPGQVLLSQALFPVPDTGMSWEVLPRVGVTRLPAGETTTVHVEVPLPLAWSHPFGDDLGEGPIQLSQPVESVEFCLGVLAPPFHESLTLGRDGRVTTVAHAPAAEQHLLCTDPVPMPG
jgi:hypothetical protein